jgi:hypothetical protein
LRIYLSMQNPIFTLFCLFASVLLVTHGDLLS